MSCKMEKNKSRARYIVNLALKNKIETSLSPNYDINKEDVLFSNTPVKKNIHTNEQKSMFSPQNLSVISHNETLNNNLNNLDLGIELQTFAENFENSNFSNLTAKGSHWFGETFEQSSINNENVTICTEMEVMDDCLLIPLHSVIENSDITMETLEAEKLESPIKETVSYVNIDKNNIIVDGKSTEIGILLQENIDGDRDILEEEGKINNNDNIHDPNSDSDNSDNRKKRRKLSKREKNKMLRVRGQNYNSLKRIAKNEYIEVQREARNLKEKSCPHEETKQISKKSFMCANINNKMRKRHFDMFWRLESWSAKQYYIKGLVDFRQIMRRRKETNQRHARKHNGYDCYLPNENGIKVRVCRQFFLATFDIKKDAFNNWIQDNINLSTSSNESSLNETNINESHDDKNKINKRNKHTQKRKLNKKQKKEFNSKATNHQKSKSESVIEWLHLLPKVPSHYCRASTSRIYVESTFRSNNHMHKVYKEWCDENGKTSVERKLFNEHLHKGKISIFKPRKDQCDTCAEFTTGNIDKAEYDLHIVKKDEARAAKQNAISLCSDNTMVITMDVQSVLLCPKLLVSKQYYKQKLQIHNFTIYINNNKDVHCYVWHEADGTVSSNEFTTCIMDFIEKVTVGLEKVILISDGCAYQNKNKILVSALADYTVLNPATKIEQIILEKGHTMMEVDSVHSSLEHYFKAPIFTPAEYVSRMRQARSKQPYVINHVDYSFFKDFESLPNNFSSVRPGKKTGDPTVANIRAILYENGKVSYKLRHSDEWTLLPQRRPSHNTNPPKKLYKEQLKIEKSKYDALQSLKDSMHKDHHLFYDNLKKSKFY